MNNKIKLGNKLVGHDSLYFIADIGANHNGDLSKAKDLIYLAKEAGADAAKFQNFKSNKIVSQKGFEGLESNASHQSKWKKSVIEVYEDASVDTDWTPILKETCEKAGIEYFTSPYDFATVDSIDPFVNLYKIGSGDISWIEMVEYIAKKGKPILLATGASSAEDVDRAMENLLKFSSNIVLMQCNTNYTGSLENFKYINLKVLQAFAKKYPNVVLGLSDHTPGHATVLGSIAYGARVIEKHFTDDNNQDGPDHFFAMTPKTWKEMVDRSLELLFALGDGEKRIEKNEEIAYIVQRRCLRACENLKSGSTISKNSFEPLRPAPLDGIAPYRISNLIGRKLSKDLLKGEHVTLEHLQA